ncbi:hypothetical protein Tco_1335730 [Tanacetum coccineum]
MAREGIGNVHANTLVRPPSFESKDSPSPVEMSVSDCEFWHRTVKENDKANERSYRSACPYQKDYPLMIVNSAIEQHKNMTKQMNEVAGVFYELLCLMTVLCSISNGQFHSKVDNGNVPWHADIKEFSEALAQKQWGALTPSWAVYGANEGEFDPDQARFKKERNHKTHPQTRYAHHVDANVASGTMGWGFG